MSIASNKIRSVIAPSVKIEIYMAGPIDRAKDHLARMAAERGACWSVEPTEFIYTGGREMGFVVRSINYPRFPRDTLTLMEEAVEVAKELLVALHQSSCSVVGPAETTWLTRRTEDG